MEKQKKAIGNSRLLRLDSVAPDSHSESEPAQETVIGDEIMGMDYEEEEYLPIKFPAFENAFKSFVDELSLYSIFDDNDSFSFELAERISPDNLLGRVIKRNNAEADIQKIEKQLDGYVERFGNALKEIERMEEENKPKQEIEKAKGELFAGIVIKFDAETEEFGDFTYEFALKRLYVDLMQVASMNGTHGWDIFDYFSMSEADPEYRREVYEELIGNIYDN
jgi:hypothetical protein